MILVVVGYCIPYKLDSNSLVIEIAYLAYVLLHVHYKDYRPGMYKRQPTCFMNWSQ